MNTIQLPAFSIIGISVRTTNENNQSATDIPALWERFFSENIMERIPGRQSTDLYCVYTDYEKDHTRPYTTVLGCKVADATQAPEGLQAVTIPERSYAQFEATGNLHEGAVIETWQKIWESPVPRAFTADFEHYGEKAHIPKEAAVDIYIAVQ